MRATPTFQHSLSRANRRPIADYALIGDMRGSALVGRDACIDWLCLERFDATPVFAGLLDAGIGGTCSITPDGGLQNSSRRYREDTNILETTLVCESGTLLVCDFMPLRRIEDAGPVGADSEAPGRVVRRMRCTSGSVSLGVDIQPSFDWGRRRLDPVVAGRLASYPGADLMVASSHALAVHSQALRAQAVLRAGEDMVVVLGHQGCLDSAVAESAAQLQQTEDYWRAWRKLCTFHGEGADLVARSALCMKLLTHAPSGGMVAAPTAGLPEVAGGVRNWDYRFVWTRDASFCVSAFLAIGHHREAAEFLRFLHDACDGGEVLRVMYAVNGRVPGEQPLPHLAGWRDSRPMLVGNGADLQKQHEVFGELLAALGMYVAQHGTSGLCKSLQADLPDFVRRLTEAAIARWRSPDQGIWELQGAPRHLLHTKAMCWVAVDRAIRLAPLLGLGIPAHWPAERDAIRADCLLHGWNSDVQAYTMEYGDSALDMSVLRLVLMDMVAADDPRMVSTLAALDRELGQGDLYRRYRIDDGLPGREGAFAACSFWVVAVLARRGDLPAARALMDRLLARSNDTGLFSEQFDLDGGQMLGNFPQAFTHMALIHEVVRLDELSAGGQRPSRQEEPT